ncbi:hypothetical protein IRP61_12045 (plasmid) [Clostridium botulinum]|nr:hypothetical protein [Clostridium botulinum]QPW56610.1 hypothetical protein IRP61_12045 [Clostridium botulinum]
MINNFKCYCISSNDPARYSVKVTNFTDLCVRFILKYTIYEGTALKEIDLLKIKIVNFIMKMLQPM